MSTPHSLQNAQCFLPFLFIFYIPHQKIGQDSILNGMVVLLPTFIDIFYMIYYVLQVLDKGFIQSS